MRPEEPHALSELLELRVDIAHKGDERARAAVRGDERAAIWAAQRILWMIADGTREKAAVHVQQIYNQSK